MTARWTLKATTIEGGFALHLAGRPEDLGEALGEPDAVVVELEDGRMVGLVDAVSAMLSGRTLAGFVILTDPEVSQRTHRLRSLTRRVEHRSAVA
jgi:hypothetical protein